MKLLQLLVILAAIFILPVFSPAEERPPNVVVIFADDLGYGDLSCYGATKLKTPNIDRLANEGRRFTDAHSASAVCTPSRYALITGRYPFRRGLSKPVFLRTGLVVDQERTTIADVMKNAGYATACIGKWHLGFGEKTPDWNGELKPGPLELGFDYYYGVPTVNSHPPFVYVEDHRVVGLVPEDPFVYGKKAKTQEIHEKMAINQIGGADAAHALYDDYAVGTHLAKKSVKWIEENQGKPFFLYLSTTNIHHPFTPAKRFQGTSECGLYGDFVHELDWIVGEVMTSLEENSLTENTLVIFTSDNGGMINETGQVAIEEKHKLNGELLGFKFDAWEGGHRVPFIAHWPGKVKAGSVSDQLICSVDLMAAMAALTGQELKPEEAPDSFNILTALTGRSQKPIRSEVILAAMKGSHVALRQENWVYISGKGGGGFGSPKVGSHGFGGPPAIHFAGQTNSDIADGKLKKDAPPEQLYDLAADPSQTENVIESNPERVAAMRARLEQIKKSKGTNSSFSQEESAGIESKPSEPKAPPASGLLLEGESLKVNKSAGSLGRQRVKGLGKGTWSDDFQIWWREAKPGDLIEFALPVSEEGKYRIGVAMTKARDYGIVQFALDGKKIGGEIDLYNQGVLHSGEVVLAESAMLTKGDHKFTVTMVGSNPKAVRKYMFGLDYVSLRPTDGRVIEKMTVAPAGTPSVATKPSGTKKKSSVKEGNDLAAEPLSPTEQQAKFKVPAGFVVELVASEETGIAKPTSIAFDDAGRLWATTAVEYPNDRSSDVWKKKGRDRIVVIDNPHQREPQPTRIFADGMVMPMSVLPHAGGAYVAQGPEIFFLPDEDGDGKAEERDVLLRGFGVQDTHTLPHQLARMPGGRITFSQGVLNNGTIMDAAGHGHPFNRTLIAAMNFEGTNLDIIGAGMNNIWAWAHSRTGRVFIHEANDWGYSLVPFEEDSSYPSFRTTLIHPKAPVHPPTADGLALGGTGFSGIAICDDRSGSYPDPWHEKFFVANPIFGKINAASATLGEGDVWKFEKQDDFVTCEDSMFRPVYVAFGPDGCLYIADWYNRIISHNEVARDHPARDKEHGRIWRIRHQSQKPREVPDYTNASSSELVAGIESDSTWGMRAAWHQISQRKEKSAIPDLEALLDDRDKPIDSRIHALWALEELGHFDPNQWSKLFTDSATDLRREAVRALASLEIPQAIAAPLLSELSGEAEWTVRYEVLRYFRRAEGVIAPETLAWLHEWQKPVPKTTKVRGMKGEYLALDGSYQRAFQDFLFLMAETKTQLPVMTESKWNRVLEKNPNPIDPKKVTARVKAVEAVMSQADLAEGKLFTESLCLTCHAIGNKGVGFAPPLDGSANRDVEGLLMAIIDPNAAIENVFRSYRIETKDGKIVEGFNQNEDGRTITLLSMGGAKHVVETKTIQSAGYIEGKSVMPDLTGGMTDKQVASIVAYLRTVK